MHLSALIKSKHCNVLCIFTYHPALHCLERKTIQHGPVLSGEKQVHPHALCTALFSLQAPQHHPGLTENPADAIVQHRQPQPSSIRELQGPGLPDPAAQACTAVDRPHEQIGAFCGHQRMLVQDQDGEVPCCFIPMIMHQFLHTAWDSETQDQNSTIWANPPGSRCVIRKAGLYSCCKDAVFQLSFCLECFSSAHREHTEGLQ